MSELIARVESGEELSAEDFRRAQQLQALDLAKAGEDYVRAAITDQEQGDQRLSGV